MERKKFMQGFAQRLVHCMQQAGHQSERSKLGVEIARLAKAAGCSYQMSRKYLLGQALPELPIVLKIATWLQISPSLLLFGESNVTASRIKKGVVIEIEPDLLRHILQKGSLLFTLTQHTENIVNFLVDIIYDASHLNTDTPTLYKVVDMMMVSATLFHQSAKESSEVCVTGI